MKCTGAKSRNGRRRSRPVRISFPLVHWNAVPLVDGDDQRSAALGNQAKQRRILLHHRVVSIDDADNNMR